MKIKNSLKILGHNYEVRVTREARLANSTSGTQCGNLLRIELSPIEPESRTAETFLHEIFEALNCHLELDLQHHTISSLSEGLFQVLRDNKLDFSDETDMPQL